MVWRHDQAEPFGNNPPDENPSGLGAFEFPLRDEGTYADREMNLLYNVARYRDLDAGRFIQADPIGLRGGDLSLYVLRGNNPLSYTDPLGEFVIALPAIPAIGGAIAEAIVGGLAAAAILSVPGDTKQEAKGAKAAEGPATGKGRYYCQVRCNVYPIGDCKTCPDIVFGNGYGRTENEAWNNAWDSANAGVPQGCGYRHCHGVGGSCKGRTGGKAR
ncbi:MAG: RHS repeat-associated core domain-containing protein [Burkholderiales bacterium]